MHVSQPSSQYQNKFDSFRVISHYLCAFVPNMHEENLNNLHFRNFL